MLETQGLTREQRCHTVELADVKSVESDGRQWSGVPKQICGWILGILNKSREENTFLYTVKTKCKIKKYWKIKERQKSTIGVSATWKIPKCTPLLGRDLQVEPQQLQREFCLGSSSSSQLPLEQATEGRCQYNSALNFKRWWCTCYHLPFSWS